MYIFLCLIWYTYIDITWLIGSLTVYIQKCNPGPLQQLHDDWGPTRTWLEILELLSACGRVSAGGRRTLPRLAAVKQEIAGHFPLQMANGRRSVVLIISEGNGSWWSMIYQYIYIYINDCCIMYYCYYLYYYFYYLSDSNLMLMDLLEESFNWILLQGAHLSLGWKANPVGSETYNEASIVVTGVAVVNRAKETKDIKTLRFWVLSYFGHLSLVEKLR